MSEIIKMGKLYIGLQVKIQEKVIYDMPIRPSHSWTRNAQILWLANQLSYEGSGSTFGEGYFTVKWTNSVVAPVNGCDDRLDNTGALGITSNGIVVGTGTAAESYEGFALAALIANGTGTGQLTYTAQNAATLSWSGGVVTVQHQRIINNNSGGTITINEVAIYGNGWSTYMLCRDKLTSGVSVPDTGQLTVTYQVVFDTSP